MRVGADEGVWIRNCPVSGVVRNDDSCQIFEVHLVHDSRVWRDHAKIAESVLPPAKEPVALLVARELELGIQLKRVCLSEIVHLHRVVDHQLDRLQRIDLAGVASQPDDAVAHRGEIDHTRHTGEVLEQHAGRREGNFFHGVALHIPFRQRLDVLALDEPSVFMAQQVFEQDFQ